MHGESGGWTLWEMIQSHSSEEIIVWLRVIWGSEGQCCDLNVDLLFLKSSILKILPWYFSSFSYLLSSHLLCIITFLWFFSYFLSLFAPFGPAFFIAFSFFYLTCHNWDCFQLCEPPLLDSFWGSDKHTAMPQRYVFVDRLVGYLVSLLLLSLRLLSEITTYLSI